MPSPLETIRLKTARARKHFDEFKALMGLGPKALTPPKMVRIHLDSDGTLEYYAHDASEPDPQASLALGDAIHQLRSSLDHLLCALALRSHPSDVCEKFRLQFPIHKTSIDFCANHLVSRGTLRRMIGVREFEAIEQAQPYKRDAIHPEADPLYTLSRLDNIDKHRLIIELKHTISASGTIIPESGPRVQFKITKQPVVAHSEKLDIGVALPDPPFQMRVDGAATLIVTPEVDRHVFGWFRPAESIVNDIIDDCERFFP